MQGAVKPCAAGCRWTCPSCTFAPFTYCGDDDGPFEVPVHVEAAALHIVLREDRHGPYEEDPFHLATLQRSGFAKILTWLRVAVDRFEGPDLRDLIVVTDQTFHQLKTLELFLHSFTGRCHKKG